MKINYQLLFCTCPDSAIAEKLATDLVKQALAACVNIVPGIQSIYCWQGAIEKQAEVLLLIKSTEDGYEKIAEFIKRHHPYENPELIAIPFEKGLPDYLQWLASNVT